jgi:hypothetical protein
MAVWHACISWRCRILPRSSLISFVKGELDSRDLYSLILSSDRQTFIRIGSPFCFDFVFQNTNVTYESLLVVMQQSHQENLEMHSISAEASSYHNGSSTANSANKSRSSQETRSTAADISHADASQLLSKCQRSKELCSSAAMSVTQMQHDKIPNSQDDDTTHHQNISRIPCGIASAPLHIATSAGRDGPHLQPRGCGGETTSEPLLSDPGDKDLEPKECRRRSGLVAVGQAVLDVCLAATSLYFLGFAIAASVHKGEPAASSFAESLLQAARFVSNPFL